LSQENTCSLHRVSTETNRIFIYLQVDHISIALELKPQLGYVKVVSSFTLAHYLWMSLGQFNLMSGMCTKVAVKQQQLHLPADTLLFNSNKSIVNWGRAI